VDETGVHDPLRLGQRPPAPYYASSSTSQHVVTTVQWRTSVGPAADQPGARVPPRATTPIGFWPPGTKEQTDNTAHGWSLQRRRPPPTGCTSATFLGSTIALNPCGPLVPAIAAIPYNDTITVDIDVDNLASLRFVSRRPNLPVRVDRRGHLRALPPGQDSLISGT